MLKAVTILAITGAVSFGFLPSAQAQANPQAVSFGNFQRTLNQLVRNRPANAARNASLAAYLRVARTNPATAFALARIATIQLNRVTPVAQRVNVAIRMANATASAFVASGYNDPSSYVNTFTYIVSTIPPQFRTPELIRTIADMAVYANTETGGSSSESANIFNSIFVDSGTPPPVS